MKLLVNVSGIVMKKNYYVVEKGEHKGEQKQMLSVYDNVNDCLIKINCPSEIYDKYIEGEDFEEMIYAVNYCKNGVSNIFYTFS